MISFKMAARGACLMALLALGTNLAEAGKHKHYGSSGSSASHGSSDERDHYMHAAKTQDQHDANSRNNCVH